jgi:hypothetical protein
VCRDCAPGERHSRRRSQSEDEKPTQRPSAAH